MEHTKLDAAAEHIDAALELMREANLPDQPTRSRELSVAITEVETGLLWLNEAASKVA
jgi:hypothetical protein